MSACVVPEAIPSVAGRSPCALYPRAVVEDRCGRPGCARSGVRSCGAEGKPAFSRAMVACHPFLVLAIAFFAYVSLVLKHSEINVVRSNEYTSLSYFATQLKLHLFHYMRNFVWPFPIRQGPEVTLSSRCTRRHGLEQCSSFPLFPLRGSPAAPCRWSLSAYLPTGC